MTLLNMVQIVPAILDKTPEDFERHVRELKESESFQEGWVHIDLADNEFVPNRTIGIDIVSQYPINLKKEAHLMVANPLQWLEELKKAKFDRVIFHFEAKDDIKEVIAAIKKLGMEVGIALNDETLIDKLEPYKDGVDLVLIMAVVPGFQGQPFLSHALDKIKELRLKGWPIKISVDGAVRNDNAKALVEAGVDQLTVGSFLLKGDIDENVEKIWEALG